jgi:membrane protease YdiL (CAAX protease family)
VPEESKPQSPDPNSLENRGFPPIRLIHLLLFVAAFLGIAASGAFVLQGEVGRSDVMTLMGLAFGAAAAAVFVSVLPLGREAMPALGLVPTGWRPVVFGSLATLALSVAVSMAGPQPESLKEVVEVMRGPTMLGTSIVVFGLLAPLAEELIFRGLLFGWLQSRWNAGVAWIVSSLAFAAAHIDVAHIALVLPLGLLFGWLRWRTGSLVPSLAAHAINNSAAVLAARFFGVV